MPQPALWLVSSFSPAWGTWRLRGSVECGEFSPIVQPPYPPLYPESPGDDLYILNWSPALCIIMHCAPQLGSRPQEGLGSRAGKIEKEWEALAVPKPLPLAAGARRFPPSFTCLPLFTFFSTIILVLSDQPPLLTVLWDKLVHALCDLAGWYLSVLYLPGSTILDPGSDNSLTKRWVFSAPCLLSLCSQPLVTKGIVWRLDGVARPLKFPSSLRDALLIYSIEQARLEYHLDWMQVATVWVHNLSLVTSILIDSKLCAARLCIWTGGSLHGLFSSTLPSVRCREVRVSL